MRLSFPAFLLLAFGVPVGVVIVIARLYQRRPAAKRERNGGVEPTFAPAEAPPAGFLSGRFSVRERVFLLQRRAALLWLAAVWVYMFLITMCSYLLLAPDAKFGLPGNAPYSIWHNYLSGIAEFGGVYIISALLLGMIASSEISDPTTAGFPRTRPILRRFLFWGRIAPALVTLLGSFALAAGLSFLALLLLHGPVYDHLYGSYLLFNVPPHRDVAGELVLTMQTSAPRLLLSGATTLLLNFSITVAAFFLPLGTQRRKIALTFWLVVLILLGESLLGIFHNAAPGLTRFFFLYTHLGPPPPYAYAAIPVALSIVLLGVASFLSERIEI